MLLSLQVCYCKMIDGVFHCPALYLLFPILIAKVQRKIKFKVNVQSWILGDFDLDTSVRKFVLINKRVILEKSAKHHVLHSNQARGSLPQEVYCCGSDPFWNSLIRSEPLRNFLYHSADNFGVLCSVLKSTWYIPNLSVYPDVHSKSSRRDHTK
jgi:hypothetical protein